MKRLKISKLGLENHGNPDRHQRNRGKTFHEFENEMLKIRNCETNERVECSKYGMSELK